MHKLIIIIICVITSCNAAAASWRMDSLNTITNGVPAEDQTLSTNNPATIAQGDSLTIADFNISYPLSANDVNINCGGSNTITISATQENNTAANSGSASYDFAGVNTPGTSIIKIDAGATLQSKTNAYSSGVENGYIFKNLGNEVIQIQNSGDLIANIDLSSINSADNYLAMLDGATYTGRINVGNNTPDNFNLNIGGYVGFSPNTPTSLAFYADEVVLGNVNELKIYDKATFNLSVPTRDVVADEDLVLQQITVDTGGVLNLKEQLDNGDTNPDDITYYALDINVNGTMSVAEVGANGDKVNLYSKNLTNNGTTNLADGAVYNSFGFGGLILNNGILHLSSNGEIVSSHTLQNTATIILSNTARIRGTANLINSGTITMNSDFGVGNDIITSNLTNSGIINLAAGSLEATAFANLSDGTLNISGGQLIESHIENDGTMNLNSGDVENSTLILNESIINIAGASLNNVTLHNYAAINHSSGSLNIGNNPVRNYFNSTYALTGDGAVLGAGPENFYNLGTMELDSTGLITRDFENYGTTTITNLANASNNFAYTNNGTLTVNGNYTSSGTFTNNAAIIFNEGTFDSPLSVAAQSTVNIGGAISFAQNITGSGIWDINSSFAQTNGTINLTGATLNFVSPVTLTMDDNLTLTASTLNFVIDSAANYPTLTLVQTADTVNLTNTDILPNINRDITGDNVFTLIDATSGAGFAGFPNALPSINNFFTQLSMDIASDSVTLNHHRTSIAALTTDPSVIDLALTLDNYLSKNDDLADIAFLINNFENSINSSSQLNAALHLLEPLKSTPLQNIAVQNTVLNQVDNRISRVQLAYNAGYALEDKGVWGQYINSNQRQGTTDDLVGYKYTTQGYILGFDNVNLYGNQFGIAIAYAASKLMQYGASKTAAETNTYQMLFYGHNNHKYSYSDFSAGLSYNNTSQRRAILIGPLNNTASAKYSWQHLTLKYKTGLDFSIKKHYWLSPFVGVNYSFLHSYSYQEQGAGVLNLQVNNSSGNILYATVGAKFSMNLELFENLLRPALNVSAKYNIWDKVHTSYAQFGSIDGPGFTSRASQAALSYNCGLALEYSLADVWQVCAAYELDLHSNYRANSFLLQAKYIF